MASGGRLGVAVGLLVVLPITLVLALAWRIVTDRDAVARMELDGLIEERLADVQRPIVEGLEAVEKKLLEDLAATETSPDALRALRRRAPLAAQVFLLDADGKLVFPPDDETRSKAEAEFATRTRDIWAGRAVLYEPPPPEQDVASLPSKLSRSVSQQAQRIAPRSSGPVGIEGDDLLSLASRREHGWIAWYWKDGLRLLFWRRQPSGGVIGAEVERVVLLSHILGRLPRLGISEDRVVLVDARGDPVQQWGPFDPPKEARPTAKRRLPHPLDGSTLQYYLSASRAGALLGASTPWGTGLGLLAVVGVIAGLGVYAYRESSRQVREAAQRVTFVTQVSHELKTPLSNIRLYAELLEGELEEDDGAHRRLGIIVSESQRLARLIDNVLVFAKVRRGTHRVEPGPMSVDDAARRVLAQFTPALEVKNIEQDVSLEAPAPCLADPDAVEQVLANLVGNVEKYGAEGRLLVLRTTQDATSTRVVIGDRGPGIPRAAGARVFDAFYRASDRLSDGVTGTGIGLTIAKQLAEETGGRLSLLPDGPGAWFELELPTLGEDST